MKISLKVYKIIYRILIAIVALMVVGVVVFLIMQISGRSRLYGKAGQDGPRMEELAEVVNGEVTETSPEPEPEPEEDWQEGDIRYQGEHYRYNQEILTFLFLGVDKMEKVKPVKNGIDGGQSDAIFLLVLDPHTEKISVIGINRNSMTDVDFYDKKGNYLSTQTAQITLQHGYGDGAQLSCERSVQAVSEMFYGLPIHGYCAVNMGAIPLINDAVGGITLIALEDVPVTAIKKGQEIHLEGMDAYSYLHNRDINSFDSAGRRLERQKQYLAAYAAKAMEKMKGDITLPVKLYSTVSKYMVTDISVDEVSYLAPQMLDYHFDGDIYSLKGNTVENGELEEFYVDDKALYKLILDVFYEKIE